MRNHQIECTETLFQLFRSPQWKAPKPLNINHLGAGTIKILLFHTLFIMKKTEKLGLPPTGKLGVFRRWLGIYSKEEREVLDYARKLKKTTMQIARGQLTLLSRPEWMRHEDWVEVRKLQNKLERRRRKWLQFTCWPSSACSRFSAGSANGGIVPNGYWADPSSRWRERRDGSKSSKRSRRRVESVELTESVELVQ